MWKTLEIRRKGGKSFSSRAFREGIALSTLWLQTWSLQNWENRGFPGGSVVKNLPASAGDMGSILCPGKSHLPSSNQPHAPQLLSSRSRAHTPQLLKPAHPKVCAPQREQPRHKERPAHRNYKAAPSLLQLEKARACTARKPTTAKENK